MSKSAGEIEELIRDGIAKFPRGAELYLRPMFWAADGFVDVDPESTEFSVSVYDAPLPKPKGFSITCSPFRRPSFEYAPTDAKAACHYPNSARAIREAKSRGFDNAVMLDPLGNVAELATANIWLAKDGEAHTPVPNGTFLNGVTRQRMISLLRKAGVTVQSERCAGKNSSRPTRSSRPATIKGRTGHPRRAQELPARPDDGEGRELYWDLAHAASEASALQAERRALKGIGPAADLLDRLDHAALAAQQLVGK